MDFMAFQKQMRAENMPSGDELAKMAQKKLNISKVDVEKNFNKFLKCLLDEEFKLYQQYEDECSTAILSQAIEKGLLKDTGSLTKSLIANYHLLELFFLSVSQSRKTRAGKSFENHVRYLFELLDYPYDRQTSLNGIVDYVIPSESAYRRRRSSCVVISIKRTLRERWRQVIGELASTNAGKIYILTADENIESEKVIEMGNHNIILVVWDELKKTQLSAYDNAISYTHFINRDLPAYKPQWQDLL